MNKLVRLLVPLSLIPLFSFSPTKPISSEIKRERDFYYVEDLRSSLEEKSLKLEEEYGVEANKETNTLTMTKYLNMFTTKNYVVTSENIMSYQDSLSYTRGSESTDTGDEYPKTYRLGSSSYEELRSLEKENNRFVDIRRYSSGGVNFANREEYSSSKEKEYVTDASTHVIEDFLSFLNTYYRKADGRRMTYLNRNNVTSYVYSASRHEEANMIDGTPTYRLFQYAFEIQFKGDFVISSSYGYQSYIGSTLKEDSTYDDSAAQLEEEYGMDASLRYGHKTKYVPEEDDVNSDGVFADSFRFSLFTRKEDGSKNYVTYSNIPYLSELYVDTLSISPATAYDSHFEIVSSSNEDVISVQEDSQGISIGKAVGVGEATIKVSNQNGVFKEAKVKVTAPIAADFDAASDDGDLYIGSTLGVRLTTYPSNSYDHFEAIPSDSEAITVAPLDTLGRYYTLTFHKEGTYQVTYRDKDNPELKKEYTYTVIHAYEKEEILDELLTTAYQDEKKRVTLTFSSVDKTNGTAEGKLSFQGSIGDLYPFASGDSFDISLQYDADSSTARWQDFKVSPITKNGEVYNNNLLTFYTNGKISLSLKNIQHDAEIQLKRSNDSK